MTRKRPFRDKTAWSVRVLFVRAGYTGHHIFVQDGSTELSPYTGRSIPREIKVSVKFIEDMTREDAKKLTGRTTVTLVLPQFILQETPINGAHNLQRPVAYQASRRVESRDRTDGGGR